MQRRQFLYIKKDNKAKLTDKTKAFFAGFCYGAANYFFKIAAYFLWPGKISVAPEKICVYRIGNIGDIICAIPALIAVRRAYPGAEITLLTSTGRKGIGAKELISNAWFLNKIWVYYFDEINSPGDKIRFIKKIRAEKFDLWIELPPDHIKFGILLRNMVFAKLGGARKAIGFELSVLTCWARVQWESFFFEDDVSRLVNLLKRWGLPAGRQGVSAGDKIEYDLPVPEEAKVSALRIIQDNKMNSAVLFGLAPGAGYEANQWPLDNFVKTGKFILKKYPNSRIIVFGGPGDSEKGDYLKDKIGSNSVINLCGKLSLLEGAFIINKLKLMVANNTGLMHMAAMAGKNVITIFSAAEFDGKWFPHGEKAKVLVKKIPCEGCYYKKCPYNYQCIRSITPEEVGNEIVKIIG
ncbi:MAG: glycosyltransferase family 9 protein [Candidatus Paceibacterota bacterium]